MAGISTGLSQLLLNWHLSGSTLTQPANRAVGLTTTTPTSVSAYEIATGSGQSRQAVTYSPAVPAGMSIANSGTVSFGPFTVATQTIVGLQIWNTAASGTTGDMMYWFGTLAVAKPVASGDSLTFGPGAIVHTLS